MHLIRQSTASTVTVGPVLDSTGAAVTTAVVGDFRISKNGTTATLSGATVTHDANGYYNIALTSGNTDTAGRLVLFSGNSGQSMGAHRFTVLLPSVFDALIANATNSTGGLPTATAAISAFAGAISTLTAGGVRTELTTELSRIDQTIGSRATQTSLDTVASYVDTEVAAIKAKTDLITAFPANFSLLSITSGGAIASVINVLNVDELGAGALVANGAGDAIPGYVWNALLADHATANTFGARVVRSLNSNNTVQISGGGSNHIFAVLHDAEPNSIPEDAFQNGAVSARVIAADAIDGDAMAASALTEIANAVAAPSAATIAAAVGTLQVLVDMGVMIINDGTANARFSVSALQNAPAGEGGGGQTINVYPVSASTPERVAGTTITFYRNESRTVSVVTDFTLTALTLVFVIEDSEGNDLLTIADGSISRSDKTFTVPIGTSVTSTISNYRWALRDITGGTNSVIARGVFSVQEAASNA